MSARSLLAESVESRLPRVHGQVGSLLHRLHRAIAGRVEDDRALAADPRDEGRPVFVIVPPTGLTCLATPTRAASQRLLAALGRLALLPSGVREVIRFDGARQWALHLVGQGGMAPPPAPAVAGPDMHPHLASDAPRGAREAEQKRREEPVRDRPFALGQQGVREVIAGALAPVTLGAFASRAVVVRAPRIDVLALASGTLEGPLFPPECMNVRVTLVDVEELMEVREHRHGGVSPVVRRSVENGQEMLTYFARFTLLQTAIN